jgi:hypothetical protein
VTDKVGPAVDAKDGNQSCGSMDPKAEFKKLQTETDNFIKREIIEQISNRNQTRDLIPKQSRAYCNVCRTAWIQDISEFT